MINLKYDNFITGEKFEKLAHTGIYDSGSDIINIDADINIYYCQASVIDKALRTIPRNREIILISHNGDRDINGQAIDIPDNIRVWYAQNLLTSHRKIQSIPIGLENEHWFPEIHKKKKILDLLVQNIIPSKLLYINHAIRTSPANRRRPYQLLNGKSWVTAVYGSNGIEYDRYIQEIANHYYTISPRGNGLDCHRTWEVLYLDRIPIVIKSGMTQFYQDLPILFIDDWEEVTEQLLLNKLDYFRTTKFNLDKLKFSYWKQLITGKIS